MIKVAVIAGTPVDTRMGVEYIEKKAHGTVEALYLPVSESCDEQIRFQYSDVAEKRRRMDEIFDAAIGEGVRDFFIYCNSLSGAFDFDPYAAEKGVRIHTPLQVYRELACRYGRAGVLAANNLSACAIERTMMEVNADMYVIGSGNMAIVNAIESGVPPADIVDKFGLAGLASYMAACGCEALILGCTHFPYFADELAGCCSLPLIDPADEMWAALTDGAGL